MLRTVGILGGMGPEATVDLMRRIIAVTPAEDDADHIPLLVDQNPQVPSRIKALVEGSGESPAPVLQAMARRLEGAGAETLAMPCNTAHAYLDDIRAAASVPVLDMIALTAARAAATGARRAGMLASTAVDVTGLYADALAREGVEAHFPNGQPEMMKIIMAVKRGETGAPIRDAYAGLCASLLDDGADLLLIACTELSVIADATPKGAPSLDAMDVLAGAIVDFSRGGVA